VIEYRTVHITRFVFIVLKQLQASATPVTPPVHTPTTSDASNWFVAGGTFVLAFVAVFQEWIKNWFFRPTLDLKLRLARPVAEKTHFDANTEVYYFRLQVTNSGMRAAEDVQVYASEVRRKKADKKYETVERFTPMALKWTHKGTATLLHLLPDMPPIYCDFGHITDPARKIAPPFEGLEGVAANETVFALETEVSPKSKGNLLGPGEYYVYLKVAASNCPPSDFKVKLKMPGKWFADEDQMFRDGIGLTCAKD
jgi:hypothetical protein